MDNTSNIKLPYIMTAQAQKHVTHNQALEALDALVQLVVLDRHSSAPPPSPDEGDRYIIAPSASGDWIGQENQIGAFQNGIWNFYSPLEGWLCWVHDEERLLVWDGLAWSAPTGGVGSINPTPHVGVNTSADDTNRLAVSSPNSLFTHDGDNHRIKINKASEGDTASFVFQNNYGGRAEIGLTGDDDFHFKVSEDGVSWNEAIVINKQSGSLSFPQNDLTSNLLFNLFEDAGRFAGSPEATGLFVGAYASPAYLSAYNGGVFSGHAKFVNDNSTYGGPGAALDGHVDSLISSYKTGSDYKRWGPEFWVMKIDVGTGVAGAYTSGGVTRYLATTNRSSPLWPKSSWGVHLKALTHSICIRKQSFFELFLDGVKQGTDVILLPADGWKQIIFRGNSDPGAHYEYDNTMLQLYSETTAEILLALPFLTPSQISLKEGSIIGRVASLTGWR